MGYKSEIRKIGKEILPDHNQIALFDVAIPIYSLDISCFCNKIDTLPPIQDTLLRLIDQKYNLSDIPKIMGLENDKEIFEKAFYDLLYFEVIKKNGIISEAGRSYLRDDKLNRLVKVDKNICIDGLTGSIFVKKHSYISERTIRESGTHMMKMQIRRPNIERLDFFKTKNALNQDNESEEVIDILKINKTKIYFKRAQLAIFKPTSFESKAQCLLFDRLIHLTNYETLIDDSDLTDLIEISMESKAYYSSPEVIRFKAMFKDTPVHTDEDAYEKFDRFCHDAKRKIQIHIPFNEWDIPNTRVIDLLKNLLSKKIKVDITFTGELLPTNYVMNRISQIEELSQSYKNLSVNHKLDFQPFCVNADSYMCGCIDYNEHVIQDNHGDIRINEPRYYELSQDQYIELFDRANNTDGIPTTVFKSSKEVKLVLKKILDEFYLFDKKQREMNRKTWLSVEDSMAQDHASFKTIPLVKTRNDYEVMLTSINKFLFESLKDKYKAPYFFGDFKRYYPELFYIINKIRLYRNAVQHTRLDKKEERDELSAYLQRDTTGKYPGLFNNGYAAMQYLLLNQLLVALRNETKRLE